MHLQLNYKSGKPVYLQIVEQVRAAAASGVLKPGEILPSIRPLAEELRINRNTIAKAYAELEGEGIIETQPGKGSFVTENHTPYKKEICRKMLGNEIDAAVVQAHHFNISREEFLSLVEKRLQAFEEKLRTSTQEKS